MSRELLLSPLHELAARMEAGALSAVELVEAAIERTASLEPRLNSYITFLPERALQRARRLDDEAARGARRGPLHGIPVSLKDVFDLAGAPTTAGARFLANERPETDSEVARRLDDAGAIVMGKANLNKFAGGESGENPDFGNMSNPWNLDWSPSGSSGGSAAQVAAGLVALSVGSDNGGSVRNPASACGIVGLKPTHGRVSTRGMFPRAYSIDHAGTLTRSVEDTALALGVLAGHRAGDPTTARRDVPDYASELREPVRGLKVGVDRVLARRAEPAVVAAFEQALAVLVDLDMEIEELSFPDPDDMTEAMYTIFLCEWAAAHEPWMREHPEEYGGGSRGALLIPAVDYIDAQRKRGEIQRRAAGAMRGVDLIASPTYPIARRTHGRLPSIAGQPLDSMSVLRFTMPYDLLGLPAVSVPAGLDPSGAPIGFQFAARAFDESTLLRAAHAFEQAAGWHDQHPPL